MLEVGGWRFLMLVWLLDVGCWMLFHETRLSISLQKGADRDHSAHRYYVLFAGVVHAGEPGADPIAGDPHGFANRPAGQQKQPQGHRQSRGEAKWRLFHR